MWQGVLTYSKDYRGWFSGCYTARSASTIFIREARRAGSTPPMRPMTSEKVMA